ncbi:variable surface protein [Plasmodium gonderi]|uniref:Variable surface protein n=1 Tax=Plasmodium gonderi TaxID=77519 RepID=A0A1Y1JQF1_PLAGO|nr:variable surface protein [Plasmodium gonderi]GAW84669.1 variable surface protein [Plasmodium gonderi]
MGEDKFYDFVQFFPDCENEIEKFKDHNNQTDVCIDKKTLPDIVGTGKALNTDQCSCVLSYLSHINIKDSTKGSTESDCYYLYYWLYRELEKERKSDQTNNIYKKFLTYYDSITVNSAVCEVYNNISLSKDIFIKTKNLFDVYNLINSTIENGESINDHKHSNAVKWIINKYNNHFGIQNYETSEKEVVCSCKNNIGDPIIITLIITILTFILFFVFYRYKEFGYYYVSKILRKRNTWNNMDNERNLLHVSEIFRNMSKNNMYNVSYNNE